MAVVPDFGQSILFTQDPALIARERSHIYYCLDTQSVSPRRSIRRDHHMVNRSNSLIMTES